MNKITETHISDKIYSCNLPSKLKLLLAVAVVSKDNIVLKFYALM